MSAEPAEPPREWIEGVITLARSAGEAILEVRDSARTLDVCHKSDGSPLTLADLRANQIILAGLARLTPGMPVVSEEGGSLAREPRPDEFWLVDPLDGTREFVSGSGEFTVNIALIRHGAPCFGVVVAPAMGVTYWGGAGLGAWRDDGSGSQPIHVASGPGQERALRVVASKSHMNRETADYVGRLGACEMVHAGSSLKFCTLAEGAADIYPRLGPTCEWDTAAAHAVLEGAGGHVASIDGTPLRYGKPDVLNPWFVASAWAVASH